MLWISVHQTMLTAVYHHAFRSYHMIAIEVNSDGQMKMNTVDGII